MQLVHFINSLLNFALGAFLISFIHLEDFLKRLKLTIVAEFSHKHRMSFYLSDSGLVNLELDLFQGDVSIKYVPICDCCLSLNTCFVFFEILLVTYRLLGYAKSVFETTSDD